MTNETNVIILAMCDQLIEIIVKLAVRLEHAGLMEDGEKEAVRDNSCICQTLIATKLGVTKEELENSVKLSGKLNNLYTEANNQRNA